MTFGSVIKCSCIASFYVIPVQVKEMFNLTILKLLFPNISKQMVDIRPEPLSLVHSDPTMMLSFLSGISHRYLIISAVF